MEQFLNVLQIQWAQYGFSCLGAFITALAFCFFSTQIVQHLRFHLIGRGFFVLCFIELLLITAPMLPLLNPSIYFTQSVLRYCVCILYAIAGGYFISSLFINLSKISVFYVIPGIFVIFSVGLQYIFFYYNLPTEQVQRISLIMVGVTLSIAAFGFHALPSESQKLLFRVPKISLLALGAYFILDAFKLVPSAKTAPIILYSLVTTFVLIAQRRFMAYIAQKYQNAFEEEKKHRTFLWDMAPFPILLTRLIDDSIVYMNTPCQKVLGLNDAQKQLFHFSDYFTTPAKRDELIELTQRKEFVDNFEVELNIQNFEKNTMWITLSSRVFEMNGELLLYINFTNITDHKQTEQELFAQASTDTLTGLYNRRQFLALTQQALALSQRENTPFCVLMLDIDHFKVINDTYGHDVGDIVLQQLARAIKNTLRKSDIIARWGGEEFIVFLHNTLPEKAITPANKLRAVMQDLRVDTPEGQITFTISTGISSTQIYDMTILQKEADIALYHSKENGRNQTTLYSPDLTMPETP